MKYFITTDAAIILFDSNVENIEYCSADILDVINKCYINVKKLHIFISKDFKLYNAVFIIDHILDIINTCNFRKYKIILHYATPFDTHRKDLLQMFKSNNNVHVKTSISATFKLNKTDSYLVRIGTKSGISIDYMVNGRIPIYEKDR